jgi:hypothetical protein
MDISSLVSDIKLLLGGGIVRLQEVSDEDIKALIVFSFKKIKPYISDRKLITVAPARCIDLTNEKVLEVIRTYPTNAVIADPSSAAPDKEVMFDFQMYRAYKPTFSKQDLVRRYGVDDFEIPFEFENGKLYISVGSVYSFITIEAIVDVDLESLKDERAISWIQSYALALTKERIGRIRSKFRAPGIPVEFDGELLLQEASAEKSKLESDLENKDFGPGFVLR